MARITESIAKLERLMTAFDAYNRLDLADDGSLAAAERCIRAQNALIDNCIECGMSPDESEFSFAAKVTTRFLVSA